MKEVAASQDNKIRSCMSSDLKRIEEIEALSFDDPYPLSLFRNLLGEYPWGFRVATAGDFIAGYCILVRTNVESSLMIASIAVDPVFRMKGVGTRLVEDAISISKTQGKRRIVLQVRENNEVAISLYSKIGFKSKSLIADYYGVGRDALEMSIDISGH